MKMETDKILDYMESLFPHAECELIHENPFQLLVAVVLSAQTTDVAVNKVTPKLFQDFPDAYSLSLQDPNTIMPYLKTIGLYRNKAKMIVELSKQLVDEYQGVVPKTMQQLTRLKGVGRKTANVVLSVAYGIPAIAVDTHVHRISKRLKLAKYEDDVLQTEIKLKRKIRKERWNKAHHLMIFFGRYFCKAVNPQCHDCLLKQRCVREKKEMKK